MGKAPTARDELFLHLKYLLPQNEVNTMIDEYRDELIKEIEEKIYERLKNPDTIPVFKLNYTFGNKELVSTESIPLTHTIVAISDVLKEIRGEETYIERGYI